jgi:hypothetical protein
MSPSQKTIIRRNKNVYKQTTKFSGYWNNRIKYYSFNWRKIMELVWRIVETHECQEGPIQKIEVPRADELGRKELAGFVSSLLDHNEETCEAVVEKFGEPQYYCEPWFQSAVSDRLGGLYIMPLAKHKEGLAAGIKMFSTEVDYDASFIFHSKVVGLKNRLAAYGRMAGDIMKNYADGLEDDARNYCQSAGLDFKKLKEASNDQRYNDDFSDEEREAFLVLDAARWIRYWESMNYSLIPVWFPVS